MHPWMLKYTYLTGEKYQAIMKYGLRSGGILQD